ECGGFFFQAEDGIRDFHVTGVQTCALPILKRRRSRRRSGSFQLRAAAAARTAPVQSSRRAVWDRTGIRALPSTPERMVRLGPMANGARKAARAVGRGVRPVTAAKAITANAP